MNSQVITKSGLKLELRPPRMEDAQKLLEFITAQVEENSMILMNQVPTIEQEIEYVTKSIDAIASKKHVHLLAWDNDNLVANAEIRRGLYKSSHVGSLGISIARAYRNQGVGTSVLSELIEGARRDLEVQLVKLEVLSVNSPAMGLYRKLGFVEHGRLPRAVKQGDEYVDEVLMHLSLE